MCLVILAICRFCLLSRLFLAVVALIAMYFWRCAKCAIITLCVSLVCFAVSRMVSRRPLYSLQCEAVCSLITDWIAAVGLGLVVIVFFILLSLFGLYSCCLGIAAVVGAAPGIVQGSIFVVVAVPIGWKATNILYGFFVVFLFLVLGRGVVLDTTGRRFCLVGVVVVLFLSIVLDGAVVAVVSCIKGDVRAAAAVVGLFL